MNKKILFLGLMWCISFMLIIATSESLNIVFWLSGIAFVATSFKLIIEEKENGYEKQRP